MIFWVTSVPIFIFWEKINLEWKKFSKYLLEYFHPLLQDGNVVCHALPKVEAHEKVASARMNQILNCESFHYSSQNHGIFAATQNFGTMARKESVFALESAKLLKIGPEARRNFRRFFQASFRLLKKVVNFNWFTKNLLCMFVNEACIWIVIANCWFVYAFVQGCPKNK